MKRKLIVILFMVLFLSGCGREISNRYDLSTFRAGDFLEDQNEGIKAAGFAADLCVPIDELSLNTSDVNAEAFGLFSANDCSVVSAKNLFEKIYPASTTKIMTCLLALENCSLDDIITVPEEVNIQVSGSSMADLKPGDRMTVRDMLYALMVPSGNDAAETLAYHICGSIDKFCELMNSRAQELGATHTHFSNPHGLPDENHYTTVYDMYLIFNEAIKNEDFCTISSSAGYSATFTNSITLNERSAAWTSGNGFYLQKFQLPEGMRYFAGKTGHTNAAGFCLVLGVDAGEDDRKISIIMKAPDYDSLYHGMRNLTGKAL